MVESAPQGKWRRRWERFEAKLAQVTGLPLTRELAQEEAIASLRMRLDKVAEAIIKETEEVIVKDFRQGMEEELGPSAEDPHQRRKLFNGLRRKSKNS